MTVPTAHEKSTTTGRAVPAETWNTPEAIAQHREMTPEQRLRKTIELSRAVLRLARAPRVDAH